MYDADFAAHKQKVHSSENEYRKRVLFPMEQSGSRPITGQEKRISVQNVAHFQHFSRPGAKGNTFARVPEEPRCEAACVFRQLKDLRVVPHEPTLKLVCGHRPLIPLGRVGVPHDSPTTRPHREGCNSGTAFVQSLQRLQSGHSGKAHGRPTRLDTRLRSAGARGTLTSGKRQCFSHWSPARETKGNLMEPSGNGDVVTSCRQRPGLAQRHGGKVHALAQRNGGKVHRKCLERNRVEGRGWSEEEGGVSLGSLPRALMACMRGQQAFPLQQAEKRRCCLILLPSVCSSAVVQSGHMLELEPK